MVQFIHHRAQHQIREVHIELCGLNLHKIQVPVSVETNKFLSFEFLGISSSQKSWGIVLKDRGKAKKFSYPNSSTIIYKKVFRIFWLFSSIFRMVSERRVK